MLTASDLTPAPLRSRVLSRDGDAANEPCARVQTAEKTRACEESHRFVQLFHDVMKFFCIPDGRKIIVF